MKAYLPIQSKNFRRHKTTLKLINYSADQESKKYLHRDEYSYIQATFKLPPKNQTQQPTSLT